MQFKRETSPAKYQIKGYSAHSVTINDQEYFTSMLVMPQYLASWDVKCIADLTSERVAELSALKPEIILIGTGNLPFIPDSVIIKAEFMTTAAACRTYTVLAAERRNVLVALII